MAMTATSMKDNIKARLIALGITDADFSATADGSVTMEQILQAFCQGVIDEIQSNAEAVGSDTPSGDSHNLSIT